MRSFLSVLTLFAVLVIRVSAVNVYERDKGDGGSCPAGQYYSSNTCKPCPAGYSCSGGSSQPDKCQKGTYAGAGASTCTACPSGTYSANDNAQSCTPAQCGWYTTGSGSGGGSRGATGQQQCGRGSYSGPGSATCTKCPAGSYCNSATTCAPTQCQPGRYTPQEGASDCQTCPAGTYVNKYGSTSCCSCCAGSFNSATGQTHCQACPADGNSLVTSDVGSTSSQKCHPYRAGDPAPIPSACTDSSATLNQPTCPATTGPQPSGYFKKRSLPRGCALKTHTRCEVKSGRGGWECIDTNTTLDACGSCDNDCSAIPYVGSVKCVKGQCQISSCRRGFTLQHLDSQSTCVPVTKHAYMVFEADTKLMEQS